MEQLSPDDQEAWKRKVRSVDRSLRSALDKTEDSGVSGRLLSKSKKLAREAKDAAALHPGNGSGAVQPSQP